MRTRIVAIMVVFALMLMPVSVQAQESGEPRNAQTVYIYPWNTVVTEVQGEEMHVYTDWESIFMIDETITTNSSIQWMELGGRSFFIQETATPNTKEAVFIGEIDGIPQVITIFFSGNLIEVNSRGIVYERNGVTYHKSFYPVLDNSRWWFPEKLGWDYSEPAELYDVESVAVPSESPF